MRLTNQLGTIIKTFAPATIANLGPGFDILGLALEKPGDIVEAKIIPKKKVIISEITGDKGKLPRDSKKNTAGIAAREVLKLLKTKKGVEIKLHKGMPLESGLGSSAASAIASAWAVNLLFGKKLSKKELLPACLKAEKLAGGGQHADNVAASLLGGVVLIRSYEPLDIISLDYPKNLFCVVVTPELTLSTIKARKVLPKNVSLSQVVQNSGNVAALVTALERKDFDLLGRALNDEIIEPIRAPLIPGFYKVKQSALSSGALGCSISGGGPSIFALTQNLKEARKIGKEMRRTFLTEKIKSKTYISKINSVGAKEVK